MRVLISTLAVALLALAGCDAAAPSDTADAAPSPYRIVGPSFVKAGDCDTFTIEDTSGAPQTGTGWSVQNDGYLTASGPSSAFVLATGPTVGSYRVSVWVGGSRVSKTVRVRWNPANTAEC